MLVNHPSAAEDPDAITEIPPDVDATVPNDHESATSTTNMISHETGEPSTHNPHFDWPQGQSSGESLQTARSCEHASDADLEHGGLEE